MFRFANPEYLNALFIIPVLILVQFFLNQNRKKILNQFAESNLLKVLLPDYSRIKNIIKSALVLTAITLLIVAAANPQVGTRMQEVKQSGIDVYILLDVSQSMLAEDIKPNRLEKAKFQISNLIRRLQGDRIGLIIFAGQAFIQFPLTTDYSAAGLFLNAADVNSVPVQGTAIAASIELAVRSFDYSSATQKVIVVITDGEDHEGDLESVIKNAVEKEIKIYAIGLGSPGGAPIPEYNRQGRMAGFKKDREGNTVITKLDEATLQRITALGNGKYYRATNYDDHLQKIYDDLSKLEKTEFGVKKVTDYEDRFYYFLAPALFLLLIEFFISEKRSPVFERLTRRLGLNNEN